MMYYNNPNDFWKNPDGDPYKGLSDDERMKVGCIQGVSLIVMIFLGLLLCAFLGSCTTTKYVTVPEYHTDTLIQTKVLRDSVYQKDSIHVIDKGDTLRIEHWHTRLVKKEVHDTTYISKTDSVPQPYPVEVIKEVPAELSWWQRLKMKVGGGAIAFCLLAFLVWIWRVRKKLL